MHIDFHILLSSVLMLKLPYFSFEAASATSTGGTPGCMKLSAGKLLQTGTEKVFFQSRHFITSERNGRNKSYKQ